MKPEKRNLVVRMLVPPKQTLRFRRFAPLLAVTLVFQVIDATSQPASSVISGVAFTTNGLALSWSGDTNTAYTVQTRSDLSAGAWSNATMRYRWPWPFTNWSDAPLTLRAPRFYRVMAEPLPMPDRGKVLTSITSGQFPTNDVRTLMLNWGTSSFVSPKFPVTLLRFTYETVDPFGLSIKASALLFLPEGSTGSLPLISLHHGTLALKTDVPSIAFDGAEYMVGMAFGSLGYVTVVPDYLGMGGSPGYQTFLHAKSEATCVVDALRAARTICASNQVTLNGQLFLFGYSQGGHVTMATHRELETFHASEFTVTASAPSAGAYDLGGVTVEAILANSSYPYPWFFSLIPTSFLHIYGLGNTLEELLGEPYRRTLPRLLDGAHSSSELATAMPPDMFKILRADYQADFRTNANNTLRRALRDNNLYEWTPRAPVKMFHCSGDRVVIFANAQIAYQSFTNRGACCVEVVDPGAPQQLDHTACFTPSFQGVLAWFETLKR